MTAVFAPGPAFRAYERRYRARTRGPGRPITLADVGREVERSDVVYVGDYHTLREAQRTYLDLVQAASWTRRRVVMALEFVEGRHQARVDAFLSRRLSEDGLRKALGHPNGGAFDLWQGFRPLFLHAREHGLRIVEDDTYRELGYEDTAPPSLWAEDRAGVVLRAGSFAKSVAPGLRVGYLTAPEDEISRLTTSGLLDSGGGPTHFSGTVLAEYAAAGDYVAQVERFRAAYRARRDALLASRISGCTQRASRMAAMALPLTIACARRMRASLPRATCVPDTSSPMPPTPWPASSSAMRCSSDARACRR